MSELCNNADACIETGKGVVTCNETPEEHPGLWCTFSLCLAITHALACVVLLPGSCSKDNDDDEPTCTADCGCSDPVCSGELDWMSHLCAFFFHATIFAVSLPVVIVILIVGSMCCCIGGLNKLFGCDERCRRDGDVHPDCEAGPDQTDDQTSSTSVLPGTANVVWTTEQSARFAQQT